MKKIHEALREIRRKGSARDHLIEAVKIVVGKNKLLCFDEFQITDIADAMLLGRIFSYLFEQGVVVIFTSNSHPQELYRNGLQREVFLEFVNKILLKHCDVLHLDSEVDYRSIYRKNLTERYFISNKKNNLEVKEIIKTLTRLQRLKSLRLKVWGRDLKIRKTYGKIAVINFDELCRENFSASDYQAICQNFDLIFLLKIPKLSAEDVDVARRLILLIDEVYENKTALIITAKTKIEKIYENGIGSEAFVRTASRLKEIKSDSYWHNSKIMLGDQSFN